MKKALPIINSVFLLGVLVVNFLANSLPINNQTTREIANNIPNLFVPTGFTFAIWGVIYLFLLLFNIYNYVLAFSSKGDNDNILSKISIYFMLSCVGNIAWIFLWHYNQIFLSLIAMLFLFASLLILYLRLRIGKDSVSFSKKLFVHFPISIYIGWITVATIANITAVLVKMGWDGFGIDQLTWTVVMIIAATVITILILITRKDYMYALVIIWALLGILYKHLNPTPQMRKLIDDGNIFASNMIYLIIPACSVLFILGVIGLIRELRSS